MQIFGVERIEIVFFFFFFFFLKAPSRWSYIWCRAKKNFDFATAAGARCHASHGVIAYIRRAGAYRRSFFSNIDDGKTSAHAFLHLRCGGIHEASQRGDSYGVTEKFRGKDKSKNEEKSPTFIDELIVGNRCHCRLSRYPWTSRSSTPAQVSPPSIM